MTVQPLHILPASITVAAAAFGLAGAAIVVEDPARAAALLLASIVLDCLDGPAARRLGVVSEFGGRLDWAGDVAVGHAVAISADMLWLVPFLAVAQAASLTVGRRVSGRTAAVLLALAVQAGAR